MDNDEHKAYDEFQIATQELSKIEIALQTELNAVQQKYKKQHEAAQERHREALNALHQFAIKKTPVETPPAPTKEPKRRNGRSEMPTDS